MPNPTFRLATTDDAAAIQSIYAPYVAETIISFEYDIPTVETMRERIAGILTMFPWLVCEVDGAVIGYAYASRHSDRAAYQWSVNVSAYLTPAYQRKGIGRGLYMSLFALLRLQGFESAYAGISLPNDASVGLHRAVGMEMVGVYHHVGYKFGAWHDVAWLETRLQTIPVPPVPPMSIHQVIRTPAGEAALTSGLECVRL